MLLEMKFSSKELKRNVSVSVLIPNQEPVGAGHKVLWLLHGLSDDHTAWMRRTAIERYAKEHRLAVVMPGVERSWYTNTAYHANYFNFVAYELPSLCRRTFKDFSEKREDNIVAGLSMGGYGALKLALTCPTQYGACISLSGSLDITRKGRPVDLDEWRSIFGYELASALDLEGSEHDLFALAKKNKAAQMPFPKLYLWCGQQDTLIGVNRAFDRHLTELDVAHTYTESEGDHTWPWWDLHIQGALKAILND